MTSTSKNPNAVVFDAEFKRCVKDFIALPKRLYSAHERTQSPDTELALLQGTHVLSRYFSVTPILVYRSGTAVSRAALTVYPDDSSAYLGFLRAKTTPKQPRCCSRPPSALLKKRAARKLSDPLTVHSG